MTSFSGVLPTARRQVVPVVAAAVAACLLGGLTATAPASSALAAILVLGAGVSLLLVRNAWLAVVVLVLPFLDFMADRARFLPSEVTPMRLLLICIFIVGVVRHLMARMRRSAGSPYRRSSPASNALLGVATLFGCFVLWSAFVLSPNPLVVAAFGADVFLLPVLAFWSLSSSITRPKRIKPLVWAATGSLVVQVIFGIYEYITHKGVATLSAVEGPKISFGLTTRILGVRADGSFLRSEDYALFCGAVAFLLMAYWLGRSRWKLAAVISVLGGAGCFASGLRGIFFPYVLICAAMFLRSSGRVWTRLFVAIAAIFVASVFVFPRIDFNSYAVYSERLKNTESIYVRVASYKTALAVFGRQPVAGVGFGNYGPEAIKSENVRSYRGSFSVPFTHNSFLAVLADGGLIGGALYIALFWAILKRQQEAGGDAVDAGVPMVLLFMAVGLSLNIAYVATPVAVMMVLIGLTHLMPVQDPQHRPPSATTPDEETEEPMLNHWNEGPVGAMSKLR